MEVCQPEDQDRIGIADLETGVDVSLTTNEKDKVEVLATFFGNVFTHEDLDSLPCVTIHDNVYYNAEVWIFGCFVS